MATISLAPTATPAVNPNTITRESFGAALRQLRHQCRYEPAEVRAIDRASVELFACQWAFNGSTLMIESASTQFVKYTVTANSCTCKAGSFGRVCKHQAAFALLVKAASIASTPAKRPMSASEYQKLVDDCNDGLF